MGLGLTIRRVLGIVPVSPKTFDTGWIDIGGIATASLYTALDAVGNPFELRDMPESGEIRTVLVQDQDKEEIACVLHLFDESLETATADHDALNVVANDMNKQAGEISITNADYSTSANSSFATVGNLGILFNAPRGVLYGHWKTLGAPTIAASKRLMVRFKGISTQVTK